MTKDRIERAYLLSEGQIVGAALVYWTYRWFGHAWAGLALGVIGAGLIFNLVRTKRAEGRIGAENE